jgi:xylulokinase
MRHYLGIDIGTFESKGVIVDQTGRIVAAATKAHPMLVPRPGFAEHRPKQDWWGDFRFIARKMLSDSGIQPGSIRAVAASAIGPCMLPVDGDGEALCNAVLYGVDTRAGAEIAELDAAVGPARVLERCGNALTSQSVGPKILWLKRNRPDIFRRAAKFVTSTTYLVQKLTGACVIDHYSAANFSPLYLLDRKGFGSELAPGLVEIERLPRPVWTSEVAGAVTREAARATGLQAGTPVIAGTIDAAAEAMSVGVIRNGDMMVMYGSTVFMIMLSANRIEDPRLWHAPWLFPGQHASMAGLATSGTLTRWFRERFAQELDPASAFATLADEAAKVPAGAGGLVMLPYFSGERTPIHDPQAKGAIIGLDLTHGRGHVYRALLEGIAFGTRHVLETYREIGQAPKRILAVGGGTKNPLWLQATSDISGHPQTLRRTAIGASYGDAFLAALAVGDARRTDILAWNPEERRIRPDRRTRGVYDRLYGTFRQLYSRNRDLMAGLSGQGMDP